MPLTHVDGATVSYQIDGEGPPLVLVSGTGGNLHSNWDHLIPALSATRQVIRVDYAGSAGATVDPVHALTIERMAEQVLSGVRSEEHTSELQSRPQLECRLLLEKKNQRPSP